MHVTSQPRQYMHAGSETQGVQHVAKLKFRKLARMIHAFTVLQQVCVPEAKNESHFLHTDNVTAVVYCNKQTRFHGAAFSMTRYGAAV